MGRSSKKRAAKKSAQLPEHLPLAGTNTIADELMSGWFDRLIAQWRAMHGDPSAGGPLSGDELDIIAQGVSRLSRGLTRERALIHQTYMDDPHLLGAYLLFYWPISYMQTRHVLRHVTWPIDSAVDFGAGPGPGVAALRDFGVDTITALDHAAEALTLARDLMHGRLSTATMNLASETWPGQAQLLLACHALNEWMQTDEMTPQVASRLHEQAQRSQASTMVLIEPALHDTSRRLLMVRDHLIEHGWSVCAPCLHQGRCPALLHEQDWCHATIEWRPPAPIAQIAQRASIHKSRLKMTYLVMRRQVPSPWDERAFRIVSEPLHTKGRYHYIGCGPAGRVGLTMLARHDNEVSRRFRMLRRYDVITLSEFERRGDGLRVDPQSPLDVVQPPFLLDE